LALFAWVAGCEPPASIGQGTQATITCPPGSPTADLGVTIGGPDVVAPDSTNFFDVVITANITGSMSAFGVVILAVTGGATIVSPLPPGCSASGNYVICSTLVSAAPVTLSFSITAPSSGSFEISAEVSGSFCDPDPRNNMATKEVTVATPPGNSPDLVVECGQRGASTGQEPGSTRAFGCSVTNVGKVAATNVVFRIDPNAAVRFGSFRASSPLVTCALSGGALVCTIASLGPNRIFAVGFELSFQVLTEIGAPLFTATATSAKPDANPADNFLTFFLLKYPPLGNFCPGGGPLSIGGTGGTLLGGGAALVALLLVWRSRRRRGRAGPE
jgi:hypothetical protein